MWVLLAVCEIWMFKLIREWGDVIIIVLNVPEYHGHKKDNNAENKVWKQCVFIARLTLIWHLLHRFLLAGR